MRWKNMITVFMMIVLAFFIMVMARSYEVEVPIEQNAKEEVIIEEEKELVVENEIKFQPYDIKLSDEVQEYIYNRCEELEIPYELELGLLYTESRFDENAVNYNNTCRGLGQLSRGTGQRVANVLQIENFWKENVFDAKHNANCSIYHVWELKQIGIKRGYSDEDNVLFVLGAYNRGVAGYDRYVKKYGRMETGYAVKVLNYKSQLEQYGEFR